MAEVSVGLGIKDQGFDAGLQDAKRKVDDVKKSMRNQRESDAGGGDFMGIGKWVKGLFALASVKAWYQEVKRGRDELYDLQKQAERTAKALDEMSVGASARELGGALANARNEMKQLNNQMEDLGKKGFGVWDKITHLIPFATTDRDRLEAMKKGLGEIQAQAAAVADAQIMQGEREARIQDLRLAGQNTEAEKQQRILDLQRARDRVRQDASILDADQRAKLIQQLNDQFAKEQLLSDKKRADSLQITQVASSKAELGLGGGVEIFGRRPELSQQDRQTKAVEEIRNFILQSYRPQPTNTKNFSYKP